MTSAASYLRERSRLPPLAVFALLYASFEALVWHTPHASWALTALVTAGIAATFAAPRWTVYLALAVVFVLVTSDRAESARGPQDRDSDRDEAAEQATSRLLHRQNPWSLTTKLNSPITTGPGTIILALPSVRATGKIDGLSFAFWLAMAALFLAGDLGQRNGAFPTLLLLYVIGELNLAFGQYWSHEELAYGVPLLALAWYATTRRWFVAAGALVAYAIAVRLSYAYVAVGLFGWLLFQRRTTWPQLLRMAAGAVATWVTLALLFWLVLRGHLFDAGPFAIATAKATQGWPPDNVFYRFFGATLGRLPPQLSMVTRTALAMAAVLVPAWWRRRTPAAHPFWYLAGGQLAAFTLVSALPTRFANDYVMPLVLLGFLGVAFAPKSDDAVPSAS